LAHFHFHGQRSTFRIMRGLMVRRTITTAPKKRESAWADSSS